MSDSYYIEIKFDAPFSRETVHAVTEALDRAIRENGLEAESEGGNGSNRLTNFRSWREEDAKRLQLWRENTVPEKLEPIPEESTDEDDKSYSEALYFIFSPLSPRLLRLWVGMNRDGSIEVALSVSHNMKANVAHYCLDINFDDAWRATLRDLQHVIDALMGALPVRSASIPEGLMTWA